ncbi:MAG: Rrf2 family transcriptional regulator, partial [Myxococcaceae bacterium]|nr:Rrf2 family transcriptional regulator [Myxococcaceae bacterium]
RAMVFLASLPGGMTTSFKAIAKKMDIPSEFLAKILKTLARAELVRSARGAHGGYALARPASSISFLDVIEALEGPVTVNVCTGPAHDGCAFTGACTMYGVWRTGQERMLEVYRTTTLERLAMRSLRHESPVLKTQRRGPASSVPRP